MRSKLGLGRRLVLVLALGAGGCSSSDPSASDASAPADAATDSAVNNPDAGDADARPDVVASAPTVKMTLSTTTMAAGDTVTATITVTNFVLMPPSATNVAGQGHYHLYLDGASGGNYLAADQVPTKQVKIPLQTASGAHTLKVSLGENDHTPLQPAVDDIVNITVK